MQKNKKQLKNPNLVSQAKAAEIAGITRQGIGKIIKSGTYNFFENGKVNLESDSWRSYMHERDLKSNRVEQKKPTENNKTESGKTEKQKKPGKKIRKQEAEFKQKNALTGGFSPHDFPAVNIADVKRLTEIEKLNIEMRVRLDELIEINMIISVMDSVSQNIQAHFVDLGRRVSNKICKKLDRVGMEKEVEKIINPVVEKGIIEMKKIMSDSVEVKHVDIDGE